jgi:2-hydroxycyclohexanecarboxyl-CoA dehydrogenase
MRLEGKVAIVTGGGSGIGRAICLRLAGEGAKVAVADIRLAGAEETARLAGENGVMAERGDVTDLNDMKRLAADVRERWGRIDVLVNNAGWDKVEPFLQSAPETWEKVMAVNLRGPINCCAAVLPVMVEQGGGSIVSISSDAGRVGSSGEAVYSACKAGIIGFSKTIAREVARHHIRVNVVCPGPTKTALLDEITGGEQGERIIESMVRQVPFRRLGEPEDIAGAVAYFASEDAAFVTGQVLSIDGGFKME